MKKNERLTWIGTSAGLLVILTLVTFIPSALAETNSGKTQQYLDLFSQIFRFVQNNYVDEMEPKKLFDGALKGLFESLNDPHSTYLTAKDMQELGDTTSGKFGGVGLYISKSVKGQDNEPPAPDYSPYVRIIAPIEDTPAAHAGISAGDLITKIGDESTEDMTIDQVLEKLRGAPGTDVTVTIMRGEKMTFQVTLKRALIEVPTVKQAMIPGGIAYLRIIQFTPLTESKVREAIEFFNAHNYKALIIDVRSNPGGLLTSVVDTADLFLSEGTIVSTRSRVASENAVFTARRSVLVAENIPMVVLIDRGAASAAEILAGALKDTQRAYLIGEKTFGKGSVQQVKSFSEGGFKLTMSRYFTPSGVNIDKIGITPDKEVKEREFTEEETKSYKRLIEENAVPAFVKSNPNPGNQEINTFITNLKKTGLVLEDRILKRLIKNEVNRTNNSPPVYDLEFDIVLREAVRMLNAGEVKGK
ncbi:MAG: S41 family peptidase [Spirochaetota bacterium]